MRELYLGYAVTSEFYFWTSGIQDNKNNYKIVLKYFEVELMSIQHIYQCGRGKAPVATSAIQACVFADAVAAAPVL